VDGCGRRAGRAARSPGMRGGIGEGRFFFFFRQLNEKQNGGEN
jgi:hypothetical protein